MLSDELQIEENEMANSSHMEGVNNATTMKEMLDLQGDIYFIPHYEHYAYAIIAI